MYTMFLLVSLSTPHPHHLPPPRLHHLDGSKDDNYGYTALMYASSTGGWTDVVRELIAADGSVEHLQMTDMYGNTALDWAENDEINALLTAAEAAADAGEEPDIAKIRELLDAGIDVRYQVRVPCVCVGGRVLTRTSECMDVVR